MTESDGDGPIEMMTRRYKTDLEVLDSLAVSIVTMKKIRKLEVIAWRYGVKSRVNRDNFDQIRNQASALAQESFENFTYKGVNRNRPEMKSPSVLDAIHKKDESKTMEKKETDEIDFDDED